MTSFLQTLAIGLLAPLGAVLLWLLQRRDRSDERREKHKAIRRDKAEEVFEELSNIVALSGERISEALARMKQTPAPPVKRATTARLNALLSIYFPGCLPGLLKFEQQVQETVLKAAGEIGTSTAEEYPRLQMGVASQIQKLTIDYSNELRKELRKEVRDLW